MTTRIYTVTHRPAPPPRPMPRRRWLGWWRADVANALAYAAACRREAVAAPPGDGGRARLAWLGAAWRSLAEARRANRAAATCGGGAA